MGDFSRGMSWAMGIGCGLLLFVALAFAGCVACGSGIIALGKREAAKSTWESSGFTGSTRTPTGHEAKVADQALGASRLSRCGAYEVELGGESFDTLLVRCSASRVEYLVTMRGTPAVKDYRIPE